MIKNAEDPNISIPVQTLPLKPDELKQILYNLLNNAIQHTENDGTICILTGEEESKTTITIQDNGQGILLKIYLISLKGSSEGTVPVPIPEGKVRAWVSPLSPNWFELGVGKLKSKVA